MENYLQVTINVEIEQQEVLIAMLLGLQYDSFAQYEGYIDAYVLASEYDERGLTEVLQQLDITGFLVEEMEQKNWNEEWEKNFEPMVVEDRCYVRASFHPERQELPLEVVINPKMSFGTGHHATTYMMMHWLLDTEVSGKRAIDAGCGTGILSILAEKLNAKSVIAFDIEDWAFENLNENCNLNGCSRIETGKGTISQIVSPSVQVEILLANINKNVLLDEMSIYSSHLVSGGQLFLSGFYEEDETDIVASATKAGFEVTGRKVRQKWMSLRLVKK
ncbi:MAG: 50S ribosomal protein L11 methyltransferase [Cytophagaceae bacterium]